MKIHKQWGLFSLVMALLLAVTGCAQTTPSPSTTPANSAISATTASVSSSTGIKPTTFSLPEVLQQDMNPLTTTCMVNLSLWPLMYDALVQPDSTFTPHLGLASSIANTGTTVTVHLRTGVKFSDGSALTASDVVSSYNVVKNTPSSFFFANLSNIVSITAPDNRTVVFTMGTANALEENVLNIPIVKSRGNGSAVNVPPLGTGAYTYSTNQFNSTLTLNKNWYGGGKFNFQTISLVNMHSTDAILSSLNIGEVNYLFTDYGNGAQSTANLATKSVDLNRMVFMGTNSAHALLADAHVRNAISLAIDRNSLSSNAFSSQAISTNLPYNPDWAGGTKLVKSDLTSQTSKAQTELKTAGFTTQNTAGVITKANGATPLQLTLLVCSDDAQMSAAANQIRLSLTKAGIGVAINSQPSAAYQAALQAGNYDLYLGSISLTSGYESFSIVSFWGGSVLWGPG